MFYNVLQSGVALLWQKVTTQSRHQLKLLRAVSKVVVYVCDVPDYVLLAA